MKGTSKKLRKREESRFPSALLKAAHVDLEQVVDVREEAGRMIIGPVRTRPRYTLEELVAQCDPKSRRSRDEQGRLDAPPVGREAL